MLKSLLCFAPFLAWAPGELSKDGSPRTGRRKFQQQGGLLVLADGSLISLYICQDHLSPSRKKNNTEDQLNHGPKEPGAGEETVPGHCTGGLDPAIPDAVVSGLSWATSV